MDKKSKLVTTSVSGSVAKQNYRMLPSVPLAPKSSCHVKRPIRTTVYSDDSDSDKEPTTKKQKQFDLVGYVKSSVLAPSMVQAVLLPASAPVVQTTNQPSSS